MGAAGPLALVLALAGASRAVPPDEILAAMRESRGFDPSATANAGRLQAEVLLRLARRARERDPAGGPLVIGHAEWFRAYMDYAGVTAEGAPLFVRLAHEHGQDAEVDYRTGRVIERVTGPEPLLAANVRVFWPPAPGRPDRYSFEDAASTPRLKVTNHRVITYRLLDLGERIVLAELEGLTGRPTTGLLALLFRVIGEGQVVESRMAVSPDGLQITWARARKGFFEVSSTVTVQPDGRAEKGLPPGRPDLEALAARLKEPLRIRFRPLERR
jgi:hypothetical protein